MKVIAHCVYIVVMGGSVNDKLDVVRPALSAIRHFDLLAVVVMVGNGTFEHAEPLRCGEISAYHANVNFR